MRRRWTNVNARRGGSKTKAKNRNAKYKYSGVKEGENKSNRSSEAKEHKGGFTLTLDEVKSITNVLLNEVNVKEEADRLTILNHLNHIEPFLKQDRVTVKDVYNHTAAACVSLLLDFKKVTNRDVSYKTEDKFKEKVQLKADATKESIAKDCYTLLYEELIELLQICSYEVAEQKVKANNDVESKSGKAVATYHPTAGDGSCFYHAFARVCEKNFESFKSWVTMSFFQHEDENSKVIRYSRGNIEGFRARLSVEVLNLQDVKENELSKAFVKGHIKETAARIKAAPEYATAEDLLAISAATRVAFRVYGTYGAYKGGHGNTIHMQEFAHWNGASVKPRYFILLHHIRNDHFALFSCKDENNNDLYMLDVNLNTEVLQSLEQQVIDWLRLTEPKKNFNIDRIKSINDKRVYENFVLNNNGDKPAEAQPSVLPRQPRRADPLPLGDEKSKEKEGRLQYVEPKGVSEDFEAQVSPEDWTSVLRVMHSWIEKGSHVRTPKNYKFVDELKTFVLDKVSDKHCPIDKAKTLFTSFVTEASKSVGPVAWHLGQRQQDELRSVMLSSEDAFSTVVFIFFSLFSENEDSVKQLQALFLKHKRPVPVTFTPDACLSSAYKTLCTQLYHCRVRMQEGFERHPEHYAGQMRALQDLTVLDYLLYCVFAFVVLEKDKHLQISRFRTPFFEKANCTLWPYFKEGTPVLKNKIVASAASSSEDDDDDNKGDFKHAKSQQGKNALLLENMTLDDAITMFDRNLFGLLNTSKKRYDDPEDPDDDEQVRKVNTEAIERKQKLRNDITTEMQKFISNVRKLSVPEEEKVDLDAFIESLENNLHNYVNSDSKSKDVIQFRKQTTSSFHPHLTNTQKAVNTMIENTSLSNKRLAQRFVADLRNKRPATNLVKSMIFNTEFDFGLEREINRHASNIERAKVLLLANIDKLYDEYKKKLDENSYFGGVSKDSFKAVIENYVDHCLSLDGRNQMVSFVRETQNAILDPTGNDYTYTYDEKNFIRDLMREYSPLRTYLTKLVEIQEKENKRHYEFFVNHCSALFGNKDSDIRNLLLDYYNKVEKKSKDLTEESKRELENILYKFVSNALKDREADVNLKATTIKIAQQVFPYNAFEELRKLILLLEKRKVELQENHKEANKDNGRGIAPEAADNESKENAIVEELFKENSSAVDSAFKNLQLDKNEQKKARTAINGMFKKVYLTTKKEQKISPDETKAIKTLVQLTTKPVPTTKEEFDKAVKNALKRIRSNGFISHMQQEEKTKENVVVEDSEEDGDIANKNKDGKIEDFDPPHEVEEFDPSSGGRYRGKKYNKLKVIKVSRAWNKSRKAYKFRA